MSPQELEVWIRSCADRVVAGQQVEDSLVELKQFLDPSQRTARQLAAHCNAARSDHVLWIVGLDEKGNKVAGAPRVDTELALERLRQHFADQSPQISSVHCIEYDGKSVVGLLFSTLHRPYLVRLSVDDPEKGRVEWEAPWREGNKTRTMRRNDLLALLVRSRATPKLEAVQAAGEYVVSSNAPFDTHEMRRSKSMSHLSIRVHLYLVPTGGDRLVFPAHRMQFVFRKIGDEAEFVTLGTPEVGAKNGTGIKAYFLPRPTIPGPDLVSFGSSEIIANGPGLIELLIGIRLNQPRPDWGGSTIPLDMRVQFREASSDLAAELDQLIPCEIKPWEAP